MTYYMDPKGDVWDIYYIEGKFVHHADRQQAICITDRSIPAQELNDLSRQPLNELVFAPDEVATLSDAGKGDYR